MIIDLIKDLITALIKELNKDLNKDLIKDLIIALMNVLSKDLLILIIKLVLLWMFPLAYSKQVDRCNRTLSHMQIYMIWLIIWVMVGLRIWLLIC